MLVSLPACVFYSATLDSDGPYVNRSLNTAITIDRWAGEVEARNEIVVKIHVFWENEVHACHHKIVPEWMHQIWCDDATEYECNCKNFQRTLNVMSISTIFAIDNNFFCKTRHII